MAKPAVWISVGQMWFERCEKCGAERPTEIRDELNEQGYCPAYCKPCAGELKAEEGVLPTPKG